MKSPFVSRKKYEEAIQRAAKAESINIAWKGYSRTLMKRYWKIFDELAKYKRPRDKQGRFTK